MGISALDGQDADPRGAGRRRRRGGRLPGAGRRRCATAAARLLKPAAAIGPSCASGPPSKGPEGALRADPTTRGWAAEAALPTGRRGDGSRSSCRCLAAHGPADPRGPRALVGRQAARAGAACSRGWATRVTTVDVEGEPRWARAADVPALAGSGVDGGVVRLLPAFDQYVVAATATADALTPGPTSQADAIYRPQGWLTPVVCVDGMFMGVWQARAQGRPRRRRGRALLGPHAQGGARRRRATRPDASPTSSTPSSTCAGSEFYAYQGSDPLSRHVSRGLTP